MEPVFHRSNFHLKDLEMVHCFPPSNEEYVPQYVNYQTHGYHDVSGPYTTDTDTFSEDIANRDVNPRRKKSGNRELRGPGSNRQRHIQDRIAAYEAGLEKLRA